MGPYVLEKPFGGSNIAVSRVVAGVATKICMITTKQKTKTNEFDDSTVPDPNNPGKAPARTSFKKGSAESINISGIAGAKEYRTLEQDCDADSAVTYRFEILLPVAQGGGKWEGSVQYENLQLQSQKNGVAEFSGQLRVDGVLAWTDAAA